MIPDGMRAVVIHSFGDTPQVEVRPVPAPAADQLLVQVEACGVCHTDLHAIDGDWPVKPTLPFIPGHEVVGRVASVGDNTDPNWLGRRVGVAWLHDACGCCEYCETGWETLCERQHNTGYGVDGGFAEYVVADARFVAPIPDQLDSKDAAPVLCAGVTTYKGLKETEVRAGEWVAIWGVGGLGHMAVQYAKAMGMRVTAVDLGPRPLDLALRLGADIAIDATTQDAVQAVRRATDGGAHGVLVTAVSSQACAQALASARRRGTVVLVGLPPGDFPAPIFDIVLKRLTVRGSIVGTRRDLDEALAFAAQGKVHADVHPYELEQVATVLTDLRAGQLTGRAVLTP